MNQNYYGYVYLIYDQKEKKVYIGQSTKRIEKEYYGSGTIIKRVIAKRGVYFLKKIILGYCYSREELLECETECKYFFEAFNPLYGYNIAKKDSGGDILSYHPERERINLLNSLKGRLKRNKLSQKDREILELFLLDYQNKKDYFLLNYKKWIEEEKERKEEEKKIKMTFEYRSQKTKDAWNNKSEEEKNIFINKMITINNSEEHKEKSRQSRTSDEYKKNMSDKMKEISEDNEVRENRRKNAQASWQNEIIRNDRINSLKNTYEITDLAKQHSCSMKSELRLYIENNFFKIIDKIFNIYDIIDKFNCSYDIAKGVIDYFINENKIIKIDKGRKNKIFYEIC